jgi:hypothetical protein
LYEPKLLLIPHHGFSSSPDGEFSLLHADISNKVANNPYGVSLPIVHRPPLCNNLPLTPYLHETPIKKNGLFSSEALGILQTTTRIEYVMVENKDPIRISTHAHSSSDLENTPKTACA